MPLAVGGFISVARWYLEPWHLVTNLTGEEAGLARVGVLARSAVSATCTGILVVVKLWQSAVQLIPVAVEGHLFAARTFGSS